MKLPKKIVLGAVTAALLTLSATAAFEKVNAYSDGQFSDVKSTEWYVKEVKNTYELGLMNGTGGGLFAPDGNVTVAEAVTMASRASAAYAGETIPSSDGEWYKMYVDYAVNKGFVTEGQFEDFDRPAKRYEVAEIFAKAMPEGYFTEINDVKDIHDVPDSREYKDELLTLYNAGVVMGSDAYGTFNPESNITRAEAAAIINRVALPENRLTKKLMVISDDDAFYLCLNSDMNSQIAGINSGWLIDNRGGVPRSTLMASYGNTTDISTTEGSALIREFNKTSTGNIRLYSEVSVVKPDGFYIEYRNDEGKAVYRAEIMNGEWNVLTKDGKYVPVYKVADGESLFKIELYVDLDNLVSTLYMNGKDCGTLALPVEADEANLLNFRYATTDEGTPSYRPLITSISSNYLIDEGFSKTDKNAVPRGWTADEGVGVTGELQREYLSIPGGKSASYSFRPVGGLPIAEFNFILPENEKTSYTLKSGSTVAVEFTTDENGFYVNGNKIYEGQYKNIWYRVRLEIDTDTQTVFVRFNGRDRGTYPLANAVTSVNNFTVANNSETPVGFDNFSVFRYIEHEDYVPVPVVPEGADDYKIGMNVCSLWRNGGHYGWSCITPFDDPQPVLGYYDENLPETADWEIKYLVEHGIDFQAFCLFFYWNEPFNLGGTHLTEGFMNAKYSDMSEFCILLEAANGDSPSTVEDWKERWVPYIIETYIKHESYATVDNRPIFSVFGADEVSRRLGSDELVKECFDYLEQEVIKLGFDGMVYLACGTSSPRLQAMGFDGCHAYNWGVTGFDSNVNKNNMINSGDKGDVYTVPTASVGFNNMPWNSSRYPLITKDDYRVVHEWIRDEYLPAYAETDWQKNFLWLSTWNEYGEGTYIMPTTDEKGFQYIDVVRETYTKEGPADESINLVPTEAQRYRINHLYPQYRRILRAEGYYEAIPNLSESETLFGINMTSVPSGDLWTMNVLSKDENGVTAISSGSDPIFNIPTTSYGFDVKDVTHIKLTARIPKSQMSTIYYGTGADHGASESRTIRFVSTTDEMTELYFPVDTLNAWSGILNYIRIDPVEGKGLTFTVKSIEFICDKSLYPKDATIDGINFHFTYAPLKAKNGELTAAFDPRSAIDFRLNCFHEWDKENGVLALHFENHDVVYTVGSDKYTLDGEEKSLGFVMEELDGLPLIPIEMLCKDVGYKYSIDADRKMTIETNLKAYYEALEASHVPGKWEFNTPGDTEGWASDLMTIFANSGYLSCDSRNDVWTLTDYTITNTKFERFSADDKVCMEVRVRFNFNTEDDREQTVKMYFRTDVNTGLNEANTVFTPHTTKDTNGEWIVYRMDVPETFKGNVTYLRFDPFDAFGHMDIDYIRFLTAEEAGVEPEAEEKN